MTIQNDWTEIKKNKKCEENRNFDDYKMTGQKETKNKMCEEKKKNKKCEENKNFVRKERTVCRVTRGMCLLNLEFCKVSKSSGRHFRVTPNRSLPNQLISLGNVNGHWPAKGPGGNCNFIRTRPISAIAFCKR